MAYLLINIFCTKNHWNRTTIVEIIVGGWVVSFLRHSVYIDHERVGWRGLPPTKGGIWRWGYAPSRKWIWIFLLKLCLGAFNDMLNAFLHQSQERHKWAGHW